MLCSYTLAFTPIVQYCCATVQKPNQDTEQQASRMTPKLVPVHIHSPDPDPYDPARQKMHTVEFDAPVSIIYT